METSFGVRGLSLFKSVSDSLIERDRESKIKDQRQKEGDGRHK